MNGYETTTGCLDHSLIPPALSICIAVNSIPIMIFMQIKNIPTGSIAIWVYKLTI